MRVFPNKELHREDPVSLKVERSANLPDDEEGQVSIFLVLTITPLQKGMVNQYPIQFPSQHRITTNAAALVAGTHVVRQTLHCLQMVRLSKA